MSTEIYKRVLFNDGEGITQGDQNDAQDYMRAVLWDKITQSLIGDVRNSGTLYPDLNGTAGADAPTHLAYALHGGSAFLRAGSATNKVQISPGVLLQKIANSDGNAATLLAYRFAGTEEVAIAAGGGVNPRVDLIQMQLAYLDGDLQSRDFQDATTHVVSTQSMNKKRYVQCTLSVKQGTAAASPTIPDPDAGYVAVGAVIVLAAYATGTQLQFGSFAWATVNNQQACVMDQRMPLNVQAYKTHAGSMLLKTSWVVQTAVPSDAQNGEWVASTNATNEIRIPSLKGGPASRLVAISCLRNVNGATFVDSTNNFFWATGLYNTTAGPINKVTSGLATNSNSIPYYHFEGNYVDPVQAITINPSATNKIGVPIWSNGLMSPYVTATNGAIGGTYGLQFIIKSGANNTNMADFTWYWAEGI